MRSERLLFLEIFKSGRLKSRKREISREMTRNPRRVFRAFFQDGGLSLHGWGAVDVPRVGKEISVIMVLTDPMCLKRKQKSVMH